MVKSKYLLAAALLASVSFAQASTTTVYIGASTADFQATAGDYKSVVETATASSTAHSIADYSYVYTSQLGETGASYAYKSITNFGVTAAQAGTWAFDAAVDFGKGGALFVDGVAVAFKNSNLYTGGNASENLFASLNLSAGNHTVALYGLEDCCGGYNGLKYTIGGGAAQSFSATDGLNVTAVPEPSTYAMLLGGLGLMGFVARRKNAVAA